MKDKKEEYVTKQQVFDLIDKRIEESQRDLKYYQNELSKSYYLEADKISDFVCRSKVCYGGIMSLSCIKERLKDLESQEIK